MATNYLSRGDTLTLIAPPGGVKSGIPAVIGDLFVIPTSDAEPTEKFAGTVVHCWAFKKADEKEVVGQGQAAYWQEKASGIGGGVTTKASYTTGTAPDEVTIDNKRIGNFIEASPDGAKEVGVRLNGSF